MKRPALQKKQVVVLQMAFRARKVLAGTFEKQAAEVLTDGSQFCRFYSRLISTNVYIKTLNY